jgi:hypothetical protein
MRTGFAELMDNPKSKLGKQAMGWDNLRTALNAVTKQKGAKLPPLSKK